MALTRVYEDARLRMILRKEKVFCSVRPNIGAMIVTVCALQQPHRPPP
jgi:hypothetical protein